MSSAANAHAARGERDLAHQKRHGLPEAGEQESAASKVQQLAGAHRKGRRLHTLPFQMHILSPHILMVSSYISIKMLKVSPAHPFTPLFKEYKLNKAPWAFLSGKAKQSETRKHQTKGCFHNFNSPHHVLF